MAGLIEMACDLVSWVLLAGGCFFCVTGGIGLLRLPDVYCRAHAAGLTDTLGAGLILVGLMFQATSVMVVIKLFFVLSFLMLTSPTGTHALTRAAYTHGIEPAVERRPENESAGLDESSEGGASSV